MYVQARKDRHGNTYYSFSYVDAATGKRTRLKKHEHPHFTSLEEAERWANSQAATRDAAKSRILRKLEWKNKYYEFGPLVQKFEDWHKQHAPNSHRMSRVYLEQYVLVFFLNERGLNNVNNWHLHFEEFRDWLRTNDTKTRRRSTVMAISTANNIIKALNTFITFLGKYHLIDPEHALKCTAFPDHMLNSRGVEDLIPETELNELVKLMEKTDPAAAEFLYVLWHTGMRWAEQFGFPYSWVFRQAVPDTGMREELKQKGITHYGYLLLMSQPALDDCQREDDKSLARKPLKGRKEISHKNARIIPIMDKKAWNIIARRYQDAKARFERKEFTGNPDDYRLWEDLEWNKAYSALDKAYVKLGIRGKSYHCCRHSFVTYLVGRTRSFFLVRAITGHKKDKSFERYLHIFEELMAKAAAAEQDVQMVGEGAEGF